MGQQLSNINLKVSDATNKDDTELTYNTIISRSGNENIHLFSCIKAVDGMTTNSIGFDQISSTHIQLIKQIQMDLSLLSHVAHITKVNSEINEVLITDVFPSVSTLYKSAIEEIIAIIKKQQQLTINIFLKQNLEENENVDQSISEELFQDTDIAPIEDTAENVDTQESNAAEQKLEQTKLQSQQAIYFAIRSLTSLLLILIKSAEKNDPIFVQELLTLAIQLCDQIPMNGFKSSELSPMIDNHWFESLQPLTNYINELTSSENIMIENKAMKILLSFSIAKASFKDILPVLRKFISKKNNVYNVRRLFIRLNNSLTKALNQMEKKKQQTEEQQNNGSDDKFKQDTNDDTTSNETTDYLKTIDAFPNSQLIRLDEEKFTGPYVASVIFAHIDFYNRTHLIEQFKHGSIDSSISFEFHPSTFEQLFHIIEQLISTQIHDSNRVVIHILTVCLRLFTTHLKFLCTATSTLDRDLLMKSDEWRKTVRISSTQSKCDIDLTRFANDNKLKLWFDLLLKLTCNQDENFKQTTISREATKALIYIIEKKVSSFTEKLSLFHTYIIENKYPILIEQLFIELKKNVILLSWIEVLINDNDENKSERKIASTILYSFVDLCLNPSNDIDSKLKEQIKEILLMFHKLLLIRFISPSRMENIDTIKNEFSFSRNSISFITDYLTHILNISTDNDLLNSIFVGLCSITNTEKLFNFDTIQQIVTTMLPILTDYLLKNTIHMQNNLYSICWLIGKMSNMMIIGPEQNLLEMKYIDQLKSPLFTGGCEKIIIENNQYLFDLYESNLTIYSQFKLNNQIEQSLSDNEFLMSIYNNIHQGAELISKMKMYVEDKQYLLKSIEQEANDASNALFAVYIKHYRRINLAKKELSRMNNEKPHNKLLSIYEYANDVKILFATTKAQGGNVNELYQQIKMNTLFLILYIKETNLIPIIEDDEDFSSVPILIKTQPKKRISFQRQISRWTKAKYILRLLRNTMEACIRFKKLILAKKQNHSIECNLNRLIDTFVYGHFYKMTTSITSEEQKLVLNEISQCMSRYYQRAMTRLITYQFIHKFIQKLIEIEDQNRIVTILNLYLPHLRNSDLEWSYLENIRTTNNQLKEQINNTYYSIIKTIFSFILKSIILKPKLLIQNMFNLLSLYYESIDIIYLNQDQFIEKLFISFISFANQSNYFISFDTKLIEYNWFRFYVFKLCENIELDQMKDISNKILQQQQKFLFNTLILNELKGLKQLKQSLPIDVENKIDKSPENRKLSLNNIAIDWFIKATTVENNTSIHSNKLLSKVEIELCTNQFLVLLLRCIYLYDNVRLICANVDYIEELLYIYRNSENNLTILLALKILRNLISVLPETINGITTSMMKNLLNEFLISISNHFNKQNMISETMTELISIYRTIISSKSPWQIMATELIFNNILSCVHEINSKSLKIIETIQINHVFASLSILGGYIPQYCLGSIVNVYPNEKSNEFDLALIIDININDQNSDSSEVLPYFIQYLETNQTEWIEADKLRIQIDPLPSNLFITTNMNDSNSMIHTLFDALGSIIQIDTSITESLILLELKRRSMAVLDYLLNDKKLVEIFMEKPYAPVIAKLSVSNCFFKNSSLPADLHLFNQKHFEQFSLSLDNSIWFKQIIERENDNYTSSNNNNNHQNSQVTTIMQNSDNTAFTIWNDDGFNQNPLIVNALSISTLKYNGWKPYASKSEIKSFEHGRIGDEEISIVSMPPDLIGPDLYKECGDKHRFKGRLYLTTGRLLGIFPTFIVDDLQLTEGKWYYCVRLPVGGIVQIGWATTGFKTAWNSGRGVGDDEYSWSYDGSSGNLYNNNKFKFSSEEIRWKKDDICGCGIEIDGENTRIKYWLNGKFLGTLFEHQSNIGTSTTKCNMLPHGHTTSYFPSVSVQVSFLGLGSFEFIFSPEDMAHCPLPDGYKPLLLPKLIDIENSIVPYPNRAYLINSDIQNHVQKRRNTTSTTVLWDLINQYHLDTSYNLDNDQLHLPKDSIGFPLSIMAHQSSLTISFDLEILNKIPNEQLIDIQLFTLETTEIFSVRIPLNKIENPTRTAIVICSKEQKIKIYLNNLCQTIDSNFQIQTMTNFNFYLLPNIDARIKNLGIWNYALSEEYIRRLFTYGLSYVAVDYKQLKEYQQQANTFKFTKNQQEFENELLIPFNEPFEENLWKKKKAQIDINESKYFKTINETDQSTIQLFGNKTYLVLTKSIEPWFEYTLILDILIPNLPETDEHLTILSMNPESGIYITHSGKICLVNSEKVNKSKIILKLNEYIRLLINVQKNSIEIYINGTVQIRSNVDNDQFVIKTNRIDLFRELDLTMNTINDNVSRIECKSITFLNRSIESNLINEQMKSSDYSLTSLVAPPYSMIAPNLIAIGYKEEWIKFAMKQYNTTNIQFIDTILREKQEEFLKFDYNNQQKHNLIILSRLNPLIEQDKWLALGNISELNNNEEILTIGQFICDYENSTQTSKTMNIELNNDTNELNENREGRFEKEWYQQTVYGLHVPESIFEWINDKSLKTNPDEIYRLLDLEKFEQQFQIDLLDQQKIIPKTIQYSDKDISQKQYLDSRIACEYGLILIYARNTILNMLKVWSTNHSNLFPLEKLGDYTFIVKLLQLLDYHYTYTSIYIDQNIDTIMLLIHSILQFEIKELFKYKEMTIQLLKTKAPLLYELQKDIFIQLIQFVLEPSALLDRLYDKEAKIIDEEIMIKQSNLNFIFKLLNLFVKLITDKSMKQNEIDLFLPVLFRVSFINLMFDLFLLLPNYQSKIFILRLFVTLIRTSKTINLNARLQQFLFHLLIELLLSPTTIISPVTRGLQTVVMDLIYLFIQRQSSQDIITIEQQYDKFEFKLPEFPKVFRDLLTCIKIINVLIDKNKHKQYLKQFSVSAYNILGENPQITHDDFENSNTYFDGFADLQLIKLMNEHPSMADSFDQFISDLPNESTPDPASFYKNYPLLLNIPRKFIQTRATFFYQFNILFGNIVGILDFSLLPGQSILVDYIRMAKNYLLRKAKFELIELSITTTENESIDELPEVEFDTVKASIDNNEGENTMFNQGFEQLHKNAHVIFRLKNERLWRAKYLEMHSIDQGGPYRDSITAMCSDICSTRLPLFILCPNGQANNGLNRDCWIPNTFPPNKPIPNKFKKQYQFIGQLMGMAIRKKEYLNIKFPILLWKQLIGEEITMEDIEAIDNQSFATIKEMENSIEQNQLINSDSDINYLYSSILSELRFDIISSSGQTYELIPGGQDIPVTANNFKEYCRGYREYRLNEFHRQIEYIRQGLYSVIPSDFLTLFTVNELEEAVCGKGEIDVLLLKRNTIYRGDYNENSPHIQRFWTVLNEMFDETQKKLFLIFVWGRSTLPSQDKDFTSKFIIQTIFPDDDHEADEMLPRSHTCFFILDLPEYSTTDIMYERLNYAITNCSSIDADGMMDNVNNLADPNDNAGVNEQLPSVLATLIERNYPLN